MSQNLIDITRLIEEEHSKAQCNNIVAWVGYDAQRLEALLELFFSDSIRHCQRASWPLMHIGVGKPNLIRPYLSELVQVLDDAKHDAVVRNVMRIFDELDIPQNIEGQLLEKSFEYIADPKKAVAIRAFSINVADKICERYPELQAELKYVLLEQLEHGSAAFKLRAKKVIQRIKT